MPAPARTTPPALRLPGLLLLAGLAGYQALAFRYSLTESERWPGWLRESPYALWPATWSMFTERDTWQSDLRAFARIGEAWAEVDLQRLFPARWESGPRYVRRPFWRARSNNAILAAAVCGRLEPRPEEVRLHRIKWKKRLGRRSERPAGPEGEELIRWDCQKEPARPQGRRL